jgi:hypothetical protein
MWGEWEEEGGRSRALTPRPRFYAMLNVIYPRPVKESSDHICLACSPFGYPKKWLPSHHKCKNGIDNRSFIHTQTLFFRNVISISFSSLTPAKRGKTSAFKILLRNSNVHYSQPVGILCTGCARPFTQHSFFECPCNLVQNAKLIAMLYYNP